MGKCRWINFPAGLHCVRASACPDVIQFRKRDIRQLRKLDTLKSLYTLARAKRERGLLCVITVALHRSTLIAGVSTKCSFVNFNVQLAFSLPSFVQNAPVPNTTSTALSSCDTKHNKQVTGWLDNGKPLCGKTATCSDMLHAISQQDNHCVLQSFQCGKVTGQAQLRSPSIIDKGKPAHSLHDTDTASLPSAASSQSQAGSATSAPTSKSETPNAVMTPESSRQSAAATQASSAKRKRASKAEQLPSLQDAPGVPEKLGDQPLRLIIVGHNPSDHAW